MIQRNLASSSSRAKDILEMEAAVSFIMLVTMH
jgi:hypothetical protein